jgi:alcohol dehydrogenase class IV
MHTNNDFEFKTVGDVRFGGNAVLSLPALLISRFDAKSILIITDKGLVNAGVLAAAFAELDVSGLTFSVFDGVQADPPEAIILAAAEQEYAQLALVVNPQLADLSQSEQALGFIEYMQQFHLDLGMTKRLRDYGIKQEALSDLASAAMLQTRLLVNNLCEVTYEDALALY